MSDASKPTGNAGLPKPWELKAAYDAGQNLMKLIRSTTGDSMNHERTIEMSYDLQSGTYISKAETADGEARRRHFSGELACLIEELGGASSILEAGVGECTTLWFLLEALNADNINAHGFDLCWSRVACGSAWMKQKGRFNASLSAASLTAIPYADDSFDVVYTAHAVEPNHGREEAILEELYRVTSRYLILLEPSFELASDDARARMESHGYCRGLVEIARSRGWKVIRHELFKGGNSPQNPTGLILIEKNKSAPSTQPKYACPTYHTPMQRHADCFYSPESMLAYPILGGIPCLRTDHAIVASKYLQSAEWTS
ncbi:MAG: class I SAM-dependent methyltransferase [Verrucomicrobiaceae bacterium]|nr:class I SAM-dependent methyltransferase [Verrucomicrobiaceae bacterium]